MSEQWAVHNTVIKNINELIEYDSNPREHTPEQVEQVANSIREFGWTMPILIDETNEIIAGHGRLMAGKKLGIKEVPCIVAQGWSDEQKKAYCIADNKLTENSTWSKDFLKLNLTSLYDDEFDLALTGFSNEELARILPDFNIDEGLTDEDDVPTPPEEPVTKLGDIWLCGDHRVMCGDAIVEDDINSLMKSSKCDLVFTDPPYNVNYSGRGKVNKLDAIKNDNMSDDQFEEFCRGFFSSLNLVMKSLACIYVCHPDSQSAPKLAFEKTFAEFFKKSSTIIWLKQSAGMSWQDYRAQHEPILYGWKEGKGKHFFCGDRAKTTVWKIGRDAQSTYVHTTQKPVALPEEAIINSSKGEDIILDIFGGSGSTLIASQKNKRKCYTMELDEKYCDVIVKRWQNYTGQEATLESDGAKFNDLLK